MNVVIALVLGILSAVVAYVILGRRGDKSRGNKETILKSQKPSMESNERPVTPQQPVIAKENLIPTREWTGGNK